ncbi:FG-nucleoporin nsp1 [Entophlyctis luteolus]|nr:FG-nucleoporin nsp1 [Entophlyctis luteolus]
MSEAELAATPNAAKTATLAPTTPAPAATSQAAATAPSLATTANAVTNAAASSTVTAPGLKALKGKTLDEMLTKWQQDLDNCTKDFHRQAVEVSLWDRMLIENGHDISKLYQSITKVDETQTQIEQTLEYIDAQQLELAAVLDQYETTVRQMFEGSSSSMIIGGGSVAGDKSMMGQQPQLGLSSAPGGQSTGGVSQIQPIRMTGADEEREKAYAVAESLNKQVDDMARQLGAMIDEVNSLKSGDGDRSGAGLGQTAAGSNAGGGAIGKIVRILDTHLTSLQWLDSTAEELTAKVAELKRKGDVAVSDAERVHARKGFVGK